MPLHRTQQLVHNGDSSTVHSFHSFSFFFYSFSSVSFISSPNSKTSKFRAEYQNHVNDTAQETAHWRDESQLRGASRMTAHLLHGSTRPPGVPIGTPALFLNPWQIKAIMKVKWGAGIMTYIQRNKAANISLSPPRQRGMWGGEQFALNLSSSLLSSAAGVPKPKAFNHLRLQDRCSPSHGEGEAY